MMKKYITCILAAAFTIISLTGCHGTKGLEPFSMPEQLDTSRNIEISFWNKNDSNKTQVTAYKNAIAEFEKIYPNIHVNMKAYTDYSRIYNDVITNIPTKTTPNVCISYPDHIATYMTGVNVVLPLDEVMTDKNYGLGGSELLFDGPTKEQVIPEFLDECYINDNHYALPFMRSTEACYINKNLVENLGYEVPDVLTWDYMWEVAEAAMEKDSMGKYTLNDQNVLIPIIYKSTDNMLITQLRQKNAGYSDSEGNIEIFNDTTSDILLKTAEHARSGAFSTFKISSYPGNFLNAEQCIFAIDSTAGATWMGGNSPNSDIAEENKRSFELVVRPVPQYDTNDLKMISQGPSVCIFNKEDPQEVLASWLFTQYLLTNDVQISYAQSEGYLPVTTKALQSDDYAEYLSLAGTDNVLHYQTKIDATRLLMDNTQNTFVTPVFNGSASLRYAAGALVEDVVKAERRRTNVDKKYIEKEYDKINSLYRLDQISATAITKHDLGSLPSTAIALLAALGIIWLLIGVYLAIKKLL